MDGVPGQLGTVIAGCLLLAVTGLPSQTPVFVLGMLAAVLCTVVVIRVRRVYAESLLRTLRAGLAEQLLEGGPGLRGLADDPAVAASLLAGLADPDPAVRRLAAQLLGRIGAAGRPASSPRSSTTGADGPCGGHRRAHGVRLAADRPGDSQAGRRPEPGRRAEIAVAIIEGGERTRRTTCSSS
jgi:hypothetical protein